MEINEIPRGQLSTIILTSLLDGDKYGYEIIQTVEEKTNGELIIKKPSLYSSLTRMEAQELVSSYWKESDIGGRRHYYRLTDYGRKQVLQWQEDLKKSQSQVSRVFENNDSKSTILQQENLFSSLKENTIIEKSVEKNEENKTEDFIQYDLFSTNNFVAKPDTSTSSSVFNVKLFDEKRNDEQNIDKSTFSKSISSPSQEAGNKENEFDIEGEMSYYVKQGKSYADVMKTQEVASSSNYESLKTTEPSLFNNESYISYEQNIEVENDAKFLEQGQDEELNSENNIKDVHSQEKKDDAVLITETPSEENIPKVKKIEPASFVHLKSSPTTNVKNSNSENQANKHELTNSIYFNDYEALKAYYAKNNITLKTYSGFTNLDNKIEKNEIFINKFNFYQMLLLTLLITFESIITFIILRHFNLIPVTYIFFYFAVIIVFSCPFIYSIIKYHENKFRKINIDNMKQTSFIIKLILLLISAGVIFAFNLLFGMTKENFVNYISTTIYPCMILLDFAIIHIFKKLYVLKLNK